ncbi:MAG: ATP-binding cassette domain-containing protein, partial [Burkholderiales bacterium]|nr:ATP-binding cassette domain-containing protein [Burkholderiales bacterium]
NNLMQRFKLVFNNFVGLIYRQMKIDIFGVGYAQIAIIFPFVVAAPRYFAKIIKLGDVMQISSAFGRVQGAMSYFINAYTSLSGWRATMDRLLGFQNAVDQTDNLNGLEIKSGDHILELKRVALSLPNGQLLANNISFTLNSGDRILIKGRSGCGKTTLLRTIAKLWHFADGEISQKPHITSLFIAQKPYIPIDNLAFAVSYPKTQDFPSDAEIKQVLIDCKLDNLADKLVEINDWSSILSLGEQQRIAFCRILINKPDVVYLDESTSALDEETEDKLYKLIIDKLPNTVIVSVAHRSSVAKWHNQVLDFNKLVG